MIDSPTRMASAWTAPSSGTARLTQWCPHSDGVPLRIPLATADGRDPKTAPHLLAAPLRRLTPPPRASQRHQPFATVPSSRARDHVWTVAPPGHPAVGTPLRQPHPRKV